MVEIENKEATTEAAALVQKLHNENRLKYKNQPELHNHMRSDKDAFQFVSDAIARCKKLGMPGLAITDHGYVAGWEDYIPAFQEAGLKCIPGVELYVEDLEKPWLGRMHLLALAVDDKGVKGISWIDTFANKRIKDGLAKQGYPTIDEPSLFKAMKHYRGHIIFSSACMAGVLSSVLLQNNKIKKEMKKLSDKANKCTNPNGEEYLKAKSETEAAEKEVNEAIRLRDLTQAAAEMKFGSREKELKKLEKEGAENAEAYRIALETDKAKAESAKKALPDKREAVKETKKKLSAAKKKLSLLEESVSKWNSFQEDINKLRTNLKSKEELIQEAAAKAKTYADHAGKDCFFCEVQYHGIPEEEECYPDIVKVAKMTGLPLLATNDSHMTEGTKIERLRRCILRSLRFGENFEEEEVGSKELYIKDDVEKTEWLLKILPEEAVEEAMANIGKVFDRCNPSFTKERHYPVFNKGADANKLLEEEVRKGIKWRFPDGMPKGYEDRLKHELNVIESMGYSDYHLIVKDFLEYAALLGYVPKGLIPDAPLTIPELRGWILENGWKSKGFRTGPGRGSAVGSLVCYLLGITHLDPIKYNLLFERFLNPERISMPDIDSDISNMSRQKVIAYIKNRYGENAVCGIMTTNALAPKGAINIAAKFYGLKKDGNSLLSLGRKIAKDVPEEIGVSFSTTVNDAGVLDKNGKPLIEWLRWKYKEDKDSLSILAWASAMEGVFTAYGAHAAGVVISDNNNVAQYVPLRWTESKTNGREIKQWVTQCNKDQVEANGLLKMDLLGLKTLDIITETIKMIEENHGRIIDPLQISLDDAEVYKLLSSGSTNAVFQFESNGMKEMLKKFKPATFEDLIILVSMYRPGPLQYLDDVCDVKNGKKEISFLCPELKPILGKTYGAIVYQEQVMEIFQKLAGYTLGGADEVRRYMSKKKADKLEHERNAFINGDEERGIKGCVANGIDAGIAEELFNEMTDFASYAFNKSHAAAYAYLAYVTAWFKCYYSVEFFAAALNWADKTEKISSLLYEAKKFGVQVCAPSVNASENDFTSREGKIWFGLSAVTGVANHATNIVEERERGGKFTSVRNFVLRTSESKTVVANLIGAGALDEFGKNRNAMKAEALADANYIKPVKTAWSFIKSAGKVRNIVATATADEIVATQQSSGLEVQIKETMTVEELDRKVKSAREKLNEIAEETNAFDFSNEKESKKERLDEEKKLLGMYVTAHPLDAYPSAEEVGATEISKLGDQKTVSLLGVIRDVSIKKRKSDGAEMAFFVLEDKSGEISVCCFTKNYKKFSSFINEGEVVNITGDIHFEEDDDEAEGISKLYVSEIVPVAEEKQTIIIPVRDFAVWQKEDEADFMLMYVQPNGHPCVIYDKKEDKMIRRPYRVSSDTLTIEMAHMCE